MDGRLGCMAGLNPDTKELYGIAMDGISYMSSVDNGKTWNNVRKEKYDAVTNMKVPKSMKWEENTLHDASVPDASFIDGDWGCKRQIGVFFNLFSA